MGCHGPIELPRGFDAIYRFLASLKLAVISISTLAATLAYATIFESKHGGGAAQEWIYREPWVSRSCWRFWG